jgi:DNA-binding MarR family transcriptional regulator
MSIRLRASQALTLWHQVALSEVRDDEIDLTQRQMAILLTIYLEPPPHTVRGLAAKLNVTKPVITRALDAMGARKLVTRHRDPRTSATSSSRARWRDRNISSASPT